MSRPGLYANIHAKRKRGGKMRKKGAKGAPKASDFKRAKQTARKRYKAVDKAEGKLKTGGAKSVYPIRPGEDMKKYKGLIEEDKPTKKFKTGKELKREKKMGGGMPGRRFGMKKGSKFPDLTGDGKVTFADILKGRGVINGKKKKK